MRGSGAQLKGRWRGTMLSPGRPWQLPRMWSGWRVARRFPDNPNDNPRVGAFLVEARCVNQTVEALRTPSRILPASSSHRFHSMGARNRRATSARRMGISRATCRRACRFGRATPDRRHPRRRRCIRVRSSIGLPDRSRPRSKRQRYAEHGHDNWALGWLGEEREAGRPGGRQHRQRSAHLCVAARSACHYSDSAVGRASGVAAHPAQSLDQPAPSAQRTVAGFGGKPVLD